MLQMRPGFRENIRTGCSVTYYSTASLPALSTTKSIFGQTSWYNNGSSNGYIIPGPSTNFSFGTGDLTVEFWWNSNAYTNQELFATRPPGGNSPSYFSIWAVGTTPATINVYVNDVAINSTGPVLNTNTWYNIAWVRYSGVSKFYVNGVATGTIYTGTNNYVPARVIIGSNDYFSNPGASETLNGYLDEMRASNIARYTGNYTPATQPFINDLNTLFLCHFDGANNGITLVDDNS